MSDALASLVRSLKRPKVLVVGDLMLDKFVWGTVNRISPEAPIQILNVGREEYRPGGAANVARNLAALGAEVSCAGIVGRDEGRGILSEKLSEAGIRPLLVSDPRRPTTVKMRMIAHQQQMLRIDSENARPADPGIEGALGEKIRGAARRADMIVVSDYHKGTLTPRFCRMLSRARVPVMVGLKGREASKYVGFTGASLNRSELAALSGTDNTEVGARRIVRSLKLQFLVTTLADQGILVVPRRGPVVRRPAAAREVYDVTGAGDTALAAFSLAYVSGLDLSRCAELANAASAVVVGKVGSETVTREELVAQGAAPRKVLGLADLLDRLREERGRGRKVVFTNGCFDLLHVGHIRLLEFARSKGDALVVALNTDASVRRLKGKDRPIIRQEERAAVLSALEAVDYVVFFDEATPSSLIRKISPDVLVKGGDYSESEVVGARWVKERGGKVELFPVVEGASTSDVVSRILGRKR